ncbi:uncharacterized protein LOC112560197 [Pomacea canaliculata]|uniref:uncharacterized protein LOC112560197 n=1 Tax=Pomacea canaliculata TaxID=400727 RepID=UPI000D72D85B|nr:uncharacterized protein LOC112560197 [Pomacea canaliculata]
MLLELATEKLRLPFAARRIFLEDGTEVFEASEIPDHTDVYISMGENYKDPFGDTKKNMIIRQGAKWSLNGIILPEDRKKQTRHRLSKRLRSLAQTNFMRIIIYKNGKSSEPCEVVADPSKFDDFLVACTGKLDLRSHAKKVFDWEGNEITDLDDTPILDDGLQSKVFPVHGPLWISAGEGFSPLGTQEFLASMRQIILKKLKDLQQYKKEIEAALDNDAENVTLASVKAMKTEDLYEVSEKVDAEIDQLKETLGRLQAMKEKMSMEEVSGPKYHLAHIQEVQADDRIVGVKGLRLKVYENGARNGGFCLYFNLRDAMKNTGAAMERLLDVISGSQRASQGPQPRLNAVAQRIYRRSGVEVTSVFDLKDDDEIWVSYGEPFISPFTYCVQLIFEKAIKVLKDDLEHIVHEPLVDPDLIGDLKIHSKWDASISFPSAYEATHDLFSHDSDKVDLLMQHAEVDSRGTFLFHKVQTNLVLYPEIAVNEKVQRGNLNEKAPRGHIEAQIWVISKSGFIYNKAMPQLCLAVSETRIKCKLLEKKTAVEGFMVTVQKKMSGNPNQIWKFAPDGAISAQAYPDLLLTYTGTKCDEEETHQAIDVQGTLSGMRVCLIVADPLQKKDASSQRFALKQERLDNLGQWKHTDVPNPEWNKQALSWPVTQNGMINEKYDWPMEGFLLPHAPPLERPSAKSGFSLLPARLSVLKNGQKDTSAAVTVVGPNLTAFLDSCTSLLNLPFAARRLFDENGNELFTLQSLKRDQIVFVTCGETWTDPKLTRKEQYRRLLLSQLSSDIEKIRQYCALRNPNNYVLEAEGKLMPGVRLVVNKQWTHDDKPATERVVSAGNEQTLDSDNEQGEENTDLTAHERAHLQSDERYSSLKWPWERVVNVQHSLDTSDMEAQKYSDPELYEKFKPKSSPRIQRDTLQRFVYEDGYIASSSNSSLVLGTTQQEGRVSEVVLVKRRPDDISQLWVIAPNGEICSRYKQKQVLTVAFPRKVCESTEPQTFAGCPVMLQSRRSNQFGHAHQRWHYNAETGFISAFSSDVADKEITSANKVDVCTYAVVGSTKIDQPGYEAEVISEDKKTLKLRVCVSCARAMRGRHTLQALPPNTPFSCSMGDAKRLKVPQTGSFQVLNGKVDLSTFEAEITLKNWAEQLAVLRQKTSTKIAKEINAARAVTTVKVMAYKNGEGRMRPGEIICGSTIEGILFQCTQRLGLNTSASKLFAEDGTLLLDVDDIVSWALKTYRALLAEKLEAMLQNEEKKNDIDNRHQERMDMHHSEVQERDESDFPAQGAEYFEDNQEACESEEVDTLEATKMAKRQEELLSRVEFPSLETVLRYPVEVWVSSGKNFVPPEVVESKEVNRRKKRALRAQVCLELDVEKHVLRQMKGRRFKDLSPGAYRSTLSSQQPVIIEGHWQDITVEEQVKNETLQKLQIHLDELQKNQKQSTHMVGINMEGSLYKQPLMKRVFVYKNGDSTDHAVMIWGESLTQLLENSTLKLGLWKPAKKFYTEKGKKVEAFDDITSEQLICVSTGKSYIRPQSQNNIVEIRANWGRARKQHGPQATDLCVTVSKNPNVDVDPFGPPSLALTLTDSQGLNKSSTA